MPSVAQHKIERRPLAKLVPYAKNARTHSPEQVEQIAASIREWGWTFPILVDEKNGIIAGHGRALAAKELGAKDVPVIVAAGWTAAQKRAYVLADNKLAENAGWDRDLLKIEIGELGAAGFDLSLAGFSSDDLKSIGAWGKDTGLTDPDDIPKPNPIPVTRAGDVWLLGPHRLVCGDATEEGAVRASLGDDGTTDICLTDPPYGIGLKYGSFTDTHEAVVAIAERWLPLARKVSKVVVFSPGVTRQWVYPEPTWVICWFYGGGQLRSPWGFNCWQPFLCYGKDPSLAGGRGARPDAVDINTPANAADLDHPCPKPIKLWSWLVERLSMKVGQTIFDPFIGAGTTIIAAEMSGRVCCGIEIDPVYVDVAIRRWQDFTGQHATKEATGERFDEKVAA